jgi:hypothetical protein
MSEIKISQLPQATTLSGSERLPVVQNGHTVTASIQDVRAGLLSENHVGSSGNAHAIAVAGGDAGFLSGADKTKLDGIQAGASANSADAHLLNRVNHTGEQPIASIVGLETALAGKFDYSGAHAPLNPDMLGSGIKSTDTDQITGYYVGCHFITSVNDRGGGYGMQLAVLDTDAAAPIFVRSKQAGAWGSWVQVWSAQSIIRHRSFTVATLPSAAAHPWAIVGVTDESGGPITAFSDGANWRRHSDQQIVF